MKNYPKAKNLSRCLNILPLLPSSNMCVAKDDNGAIHRIIVMVPRTFIIMLTRILMRATKNNQEFLIQRLICCNLTGSQPT